MSLYTELLNPIDIDTLRENAAKAESFPHFSIDNFLREDFACEVLEAFPSYDKALGMGRSFNAVNEAKKVQVTDSKLFSPPIAKLNELLASDEFVQKLSYILDIPDLLADPNLAGGGIHETKGGGRLDVHVDFNFNDELALHRRANVLIYFNKDWKKEYGGILDLWDKDVKVCHAEISPIFNRMACFATSEISYHGVTPLKCPENETRKSFAAYYYTKEAPEGWSGERHSTIFKARPHEWMQANINMPAEKIKRKIHSYMASVKQAIKNIIGK